ncbi:vWA domain-containing protein [Nitrosophilus kaiyonis]|uniref:vWA domain-containing protein n=1 Tax=Nitrosophilus kaiyonis TaxID=2930200 RepID=UPI00248FB0ED|nr:VWA domain-containing protein [Nitrosophilus kaiyonis]
MNISFDYPIFFIFLIFLICFYRCKREKLKIYFSKTSLLPKKIIGRKNFLPILIFLSSVLALGSPFSYDSILQNPKKGRDLVIALDASGSMGSEMDGKSKFELVLELVKKFLQTRYDDNVGFVVFGSFAYPASPITYDIKALQFILNYLDISIAGNNTAIGEAIKVSVDLLKKSSAKEKVIILFTDGYHNSGYISPKDALKEAKKINAKIYTIGIGEEFDKNLLKKIAQESGGKSFSAKNQEDLKEIINEIQKLEKSPIRAGVYLNKKALFEYALIFLALLLLIDIKRKI